MTAQLPTLEEASSLVKRLQPVNYKSQLLSAPVAAKCTLVPPLASTMGDQFKRQQQNSDPTGHLLLIPPLKSTLDGLSGQFGRRIVKRCALSALSATTFQYIRHRLDEEILRSEASASRPLRALGFRRGPRSTGIDKVAQRSLPQVIRQLDFDVESATRLLRRETSSDPRPNKALHPDVVSKLLAGYEHADLVTFIMTKGIEPAWMFKPPSRTAPKIINRVNGSCQQ